MGSERPGGLEKGSGDRVGRGRWRSERSRAQRGWVVTSLCPRFIAQRAGAGATRILMLDHLEQSYSFTSPGQVPLSSSCQQVSGHAC